MLTGLQVLLGVGIQVMQSPTSLKLFVSLNKAEVVSDIKELISIFNFLWVSQKVDILRTLQKTSYIKKKKILFYPTPKLYNVRH